MTEGEGSYKGSCYREVACPGASHLVILDLKSLSTLSRFHNNAHRVAHACHIPTLLFLGCFS